MTTEEKSVFDRILDAVYGKDETVLPDVVALAAVRSGDETEFSYREFFVAFSVEQLRSNKVVLDYVFSLRFPKAPVAITVHEDDGRGPSIEMSGRVPTIVFGEMMSNEFSHWTSLGRISRRSVAQMYKLAATWLRWRNS